MSTALAATDRLTINYTVLTLAHKITMYCKQGSPIAGVAQVLDRDGVSLIAVASAAQFVWDTMRDKFTTTVLAADYLLEHRSGIAWNPVEADVLTGIGTGGSAAVASQFTLVLRDTSFLKIHNLLLEHSEGYAGHSNTGLGLNTPLDNYVLAYISDIDPVCQWHWVKSRGDHYILASGAGAGGTLGLNDKIRRARGLT